MGFRAIYSGSNNYDNFGHFDLCYESVIVPAVTTVLSEPDSRGRTAPGPASDLRCDRGTSLPHSECGEMPRARVRARETCGDPEGYLRRDSTTASAIRDRNHGAVSEG